MRLVLFQFLVEVEVEVEAKVVIQVEVEIDVVFKVEIEVGVKYDVQAEVKVEITSTVLTSRLRFMLMPRTSFRPESSVGNRGVTERQ